jgi:hypothetical protein
MASRLGLGHFAVVVTPQGRTMAAFAHSLQAPLVAAMILQEMCTLQSSAVHLRSF